MVTFKQQKIREKTAKQSVEQHLKNAKRLTRFSVIDHMGVWSRNPILSNNRSIVRIIGEVKQKGLPKARIGIAFDKYVIGRNTPATHFNLVYYPQINHIYKFSEAAKQRRELGPGEKFPGAVGSMHAVLVKRGVKKLLRLSYIQAHFKTGDIISRNIATKYGGWRIRLLNTLFELVEAEKVTKIEYLDKAPSAFSKEEAKTIDNRFNEFKKVAEANGFVVKREQIAGSTSAEITATKI